MKRIISFVIVLSMLLSFAGCSAKRESVDLGALKGDNVQTTDAENGDEPGSDKAEDSTKYPEETTEEVKEGFEVPPYDGGFELGNYEGGKYYNRFFGIGMDIDDDWNVYSFEELMEINGVFADLEKLSEEDYEATLADGQVAGFNDFFAIEDSVSNYRRTIIQVSAVNTSVDESTLSELESDPAAFKDFLAEGTLPFVEEGLEESGIAIRSEGEFVEVDLNGTPALAVRYTATNNGYVCYMDIVVKTAGSYLVTAIVASTVGKNAVSDVLDRMYILD